MTGNPNDGNASVAAEPGTPTPASPTPTDPAPSGGEVPVWFKQYTEQLDGRLASLDKSFKTTQGQARQTENEFRRWMGDVEKLEKSGLSRDDAIAQLESRQQENQWRTTIEKQLQDIASIVQRGGTASPVGQTVTDVFVSKGLDPKDVRVQQSLLKPYASRDEMELAAFRLREEINNSPNPTQAQSASMSGGTSGTRSPDVIYAEYEEAFKNTTQNAGILARLEEEMKGLGQ